MHSFYHWRTRSEVTWKPLHYYFRNIHGNNSFKLKNSNDKALRCPGETQFMYMHFSFYQPCDNCEHWFTAQSHWPSREFVQYNIVASKLKYDHHPCSHREFKPVFPDLLWWNKLQQNKARKIRVCDGSPSPTWGEEVDIFIATMCEQVRDFSTKMAATMGWLMATHVESNLHRKIYIQGIHKLTSSKIPNQINWQV